MLSRKRIKWTFELVKEFVEKLGYELISNNYITSKTSIILKDKNGYFYLTTVDSLRSGFTPRLVDKKNSYSIQNIKLWCKLNNKPFELISTLYKGKSINLQWKCLKKECDEVFNSCWNAIGSQSQGCPYCSGRETNLSNCLATKRPELAVEWHPIKNGDLTPYDITASSGKDVWWECKEKHEWCVSPNQRNKSNCPYCSGRYATEKNNLLVDNPILCEEWNYKKNGKNPDEYTPNSYQKVWWKCKKCGYEWPAVIANRNNNNTQCPICSQSKGEDKIKEWLSVNTVDHVPQKTFDGLIGLGNGNLSYDFYLPVYNLLIEYQGEFHDGTASIQTKEGFKIQQEHDKRKKEYAQNNNINLLEIWYWDFDKIEEILEDEFIKYNKEEIQEAI
jgi:hypothetical protein